MTASVFRVTVDIIAVILGGEVGRGRGAKTNERKKKSTHRVPIEQVETNFAVAIVRR